MRGATEPRSDARRADGISIHAPLAGCDGYGDFPASTRRISIHAPLAGCDCIRSSSAGFGSDFNPRTPCGVRLSQLRHEPGEYGFQSTHPLRGATCGLDLHLDIRLHFNPRTPCGVRLTLFRINKTEKIISIHAPLAGCDGSAGRSSARRHWISIHAPLAGCDSAYESRHEEKYGISIHAPLAGCDSCRSNSRTMPKRFQSTHPLRGATAKLPKYSRQICAKATKFLQSQTKSGVAACWEKGKRPLFPALRGANLPGKPETLPVRIRQSARPLARNRPWHRSAQRAFHTCCRDNKSAGCLFLCP